jgi:hypothetical protein
MSAKIMAVDGNVITVALTGKLSHAELSAVQRETAAEIRQCGNVSILVLADAFDGWEKEGDWGDLSFQSEYDTQMDKIAIVGDKKWELLALLFAGQGLRPTPVEFFATEDLPKARLWLSEKP